MSNPTIRITARANETVIELDRGTDRFVEIPAILGGAVARIADPATRLKWSPTLCDGKNVTFKQAEKACAELGEGWRLPTRMELESILDLTRHNPCIDTEQFPDTKSDWYWSSTPCAWSPDHAWFVSFDSGFADGNLRDYNGACVRAVRSVPSGQ